MGCHNRMLPGQFARLTNIVLEEPQDTGEVGASSLSECLTNDPMSPWSRGRAECAVAGVLRWAGAGPVFLDV